jgi:restriction system protein
VEDLRQVWSESSNRAARITSASDLTLGNYRYLLADEDRWEKLAWPFERDDFIARLEGVTRFRNSVAHWSIDAPGRESGELAAAKQFLNMLKVVDCG